MKKRVDVFALSVYDLVVFPKALGHINEAISDLFDRLDKRGAVEYVSLLVLRQYRSRQFILATQGLAQCEFSYKELGKKIEQLKEKKMRLRLDVDILKLEVNKLRKGKNKAEEYLDSLKTDYKKLRLSIRTVDLGKTSEQWRQEIKEEKVRVNQ
ncbi:hypothetical protein Gogos_020903 [Gossypium gossypioides]|uniref:Uncharacterized protein n=1 Tax=Gossypium gossypioides TaxID=34282 RepID=A0A7J9D7L9_GOSGO|nr:hypothetical protein [Gossypium gossypioides]